MSLLRIVTLLIMGFFSVEANNMVTTLTPVGFTSARNKDFYGTVVIATSKYLFVGAQGSIAIHDWQSFRQIWTLWIDAKHFSASRDGSRLAVPRDGVVEIYNVDTKSLTSTLNGVMAQLSPDGNTLAVSNGRVTIYGYSQGQWIKQEELMDASHDFAASFFSSNGKRVAIADSNMQEQLIRVYEKTTYGWSALGQDLFGTSMALSGDGNTLVVGSENSDADGVLRGVVKTFVYDHYQDLWIQTGQISGNEDFERFGRSVAITEDGTMIAGSSYFHREQRGVIRFFDLSHGQWEHIAETEGDRIGDRLGYGRSGMSLLPDGSAIAVGAPVAPNNDGLKGYVFLYDISKVPVAPPTVDSAQTSSAADEQTFAPSLSPSVLPSSSPTMNPSATPSGSPSFAASLTPSSAPSLAPSLGPSATPSGLPSMRPSNASSLTPSSAPSLSPSLGLSADPSRKPSLRTSSAPSNGPHDKNLLLSQASPSSSSANVLSIITPAIILLITMGYEF